jgi:hypothetical protein
MNKIKNALIAFISLTVVMAVVTAVPTQGQGGNKDVNVVNTPNVNVVNTPTVQAQQNGAWNVGITGSPTVQVGNSSSNPVLVRDVDRPTAQPFQLELDVEMADGFGGQNAGFIIPVGKLLVIEQVSAIGTVPAGQHLNFSILSHVLPDLTQRPHYLSSVQSASPQTFYVQSQQVRIYADASAAVRIDRGTFNTGVASATFVVSGYLINK